MDAGTVASPAEKIFGLELTLSPISEYTFDF
jgi:hypothetical protein